MTPPYLTSKQAAKRLGTSFRMVGKLTRSGELKCLPRSSEKSPIYVELDSVNAYIAKQAPRDGTYLNRSELAAITKWSEGQISGQTTRNNEDATKGLIHTKVAGRNMYPINQPLIQKALHPVPEQTLFDQPVPSVEDRLTRIESFVERFQSFMTNGPQQ